MASIEEIKKLREQSGAGVNAIREALAESKGDTEKALAFLRKKGIAKAEKRKNKTAAEGLLGTYIHGNGKVVTVVEVGTETDFAAKSEDLKKFATDLALQVAAVNPVYLDVDSIPAEELAKEKEVFEKELKDKPDGVKDKIIEGKMQKIYEEKVLMKQPLFVDDSKTVEDSLNDLVAKIGEKIEVRSFSKFEVAQPIHSCTKIVVNEPEESNE